MRTTLVALLALALLGTSCGNSVECGKGTTENDGVCEPTTGGSNNSTNNGTTATNNGSTGGGSDVTCGPNTELDDQNRCVVSDAVTCASGTQLDATNGECVVTDEVCGARTAFDGTSCLPTDEVCGDGTSFNEGLGVCLSDTECAAGDVVLRGVCVSPAEQMRDNADLTEAENNDPAHGGTPDSVTLLGAGQDLVIAGSTALPTDLDADDIDDVDFDVFEFDGTAGQWVTVTLQPVDGAPLGFEVQGPNGYSRRELGQDYGATRSFVLTEDGTYSLTIAPRSALDFGEPNAVEGDWVATVTVDAKPLPTPADYSAGVEGTFQRPEDSYFTELLDPSSTVSVQLQGGGVFVVYNGNDEVIASGFNANVTVPDTGTFNVVVDRTFARLGEDWSLVVTSAVDIGTLTPPTPLTTTVADTATSGALSLTVPAGVIPVVTQTNPQNEAVTVNASINGFSSQNFINDSTGTANTMMPLPIALAGGQLALNLGAGPTDVTVTVDTIPSSDQGTFADGGSLNLTEANAVTRGTYVYHRFNLSEDLAWTGTLDAAGADIDAQLFASTGESVGRWTAFGGEEIASILPAGEYYLELRAFADLPNGWTLASDFAAAVVATETEPNDDSANANPVVPGTFYEGNLEPGGADFFELTVTTPAAYSINANAPLDVAVQNDMGEILASGGGGLALFLEPGTFYIALAGFGDGDYVLVVNEIAAQGTVLDAGGNDDSANAQPVAGLTETVEGLINGVGDTDWYAFTVAAQTVVFDTAPVVVYDDQLMPLVPVDGRITLPVGTVYVEVPGSLFMPGGPSGYLLRLNAAPTNSVTSTPALVVPDATPPLAVTDVITVAQGGGPPCTISNIAIGMDLTHAFAGDLTIDLESPDGTVVRLWDRNGGVDIVGTFPATLQPAESLDAFLGETVSGDWTLTLTDEVNVDEGLLNSWSLLYDCQ